MKCLLVLAAVLAVSSGLELEGYEQYEDDPPFLLGLEAVDPPGIVVTWLPVQELAGKPVQGYKVHVWELRHVETERYTLEDGRTVHVWELQDVETKHYKLVDGTPVHVYDLPEVETDRFTLVDGTPVKLIIISSPKPIDVVDVVGADINKFIYRPIKLHVHYEIRVQAYNSEGTGLLSNAFGLRLGD